MQNDTDNRNSEIKTFYAKEDHYYHQQLTKLEHEFTSNKNNGKCQYD